MVLYSTACCSSLFVKDGCLSKMGSGKNIYLNCVLCNLVAYSVGLVNFLEPYLVSDDYVRSDIWLY